MEEMAFDSWLKTDSEQGYITFRTLISVEQFEEFSRLEKEASFVDINVYAVRMLLDEYKESLLY